MRSRAEVVKLANSWVGKKVSDGSYMEIINIYNGYKKRPRNGLKMDPSWAWCACTWSALAIKLGYTDIMPVEISCGNLITIAKNMGIWVENDAYVPKPGDAVLYDWDDNGVGDNTGWPDHIGTVEKASGNTITVIEGNYGNAVKKRNITVNAKYIRGFITPKYDKETTTSTSSKPATSTPAVSTSATKEVKASRGADFKNASLAGTYETVGKYYCRDGAGTDKKELCVIPEGTRVKCYGYYNVNKADNVKWLYVQFTLNGIQYTGFTSSKGLKKVG